MKKNESGRTIAFLVVAGVSIGLALLLSPPREITPEFFTKAQVGKPFYADFSPNDATSITVVGFDETQATARVFGVKLQDGKWTIPSHHNYPADGQDRLAKTAASAKGIKRDELASNSKQAQEQLGVIDPLDKDRTELKGRGQRITLKKGEDVLVDLIVGKQVKDRSGFYYVRKPDEDATYVAKLDLNLSTKFSDWVETDLLKLNRDDLKEMVIDNYSIDKNQMVVTKGEVLTLDRDKIADPWKLEGLDEAKEEVEVSKVNGMLGALDELKLVGVRPKPKGFRPDLTLDPEFVKKQSDLNALALDLQSRGFALSMDKQKKFRLYSDQGDLTAATNKGVVYTLRFGDLFLGDETEIEVGGASKEDSSRKEKEGDENKEGSDGDDKSKGKESGKQSSRYLFVTVNFDEKFLGPRPEKPAPPEGLAASDGESPRINPKQDPDEKAPEKLEAENKAEEDKPEPAKSKAGEGARADENCVPGAGDDEPAKEEEKGDDEEKPAQKDDQKTDKSQDAAKDDQTEEKKQDKPEEKKKSADDLKKEYDAQVKKYEADLKTFEDKVKDGKKQVDELNSRFGAWYYVISADNFNKLHLTRKDLVKEKSKPADAKPTGPTTPPKDEGDEEKSNDQDGKEEKQN